MRFVIFWMPELEKLSRYGRFSEFDRDVYEKTLDLIKNFNGGIAG